MPRKATARDEAGTIDLSPFYEGITLLKFGRSGQPHEKIFTLTRSNRYVVWRAGTWTFKFGKECEIDLEKVVRIQVGQMTAPFIKQAQTFGPASDRSLSVIYTNDEGKETSLDLVAPNDHVFKYVNRVLRKVVADLNEEKRRTSVEKRFLKAKWEAADSDHSGCLTRREIIGIVSSMNINRSRAKIIEIFNSVDADASGELDFNEFLIFMQRLRRRPELEVLWANLNNPTMNTAFAPLQLPAESDADTVSQITTKTISVRRLQEFWYQFQGEDITLEEAMEKIARVSGVEAVDPARHNEIGYYEWRHLLTSAENDVFSPHFTEEYQDMTRPLSDYFIASSHNTYLEGDQLTSKSSVNRYIDDLSIGCRCVELDCWDGPKGEPIVYHGHTLTSKINFRDIVTAIKMYGFNESPYPVILSIENHLSPPQQKKLAKICKDILGDKLALPLQNVGPTLPSPMDLKFKVLLKGKRIKVHGIEHEGDKEEDDEEPQVGAAPAKKSSKKKAGGEEETETVEELSSITFLATGKVKAFTKEISGSIPADYMASYSEGTTDKNMKKPDIVQGWINHNKTHLSRIYPKGTRVDSSNYDPCSAWAAGNQMVALNYQTPDLSMHVNYGKYRENGRRGYVLKPAYMLYTAPGIGSPAQSPPVCVSVHIISGQQIPKAGGKKSGDIIDPFVSVIMNGAHEDHKIYNTKVINNNGFNPVWDEIFEFTVTNPDCAHLTLVVKHLFIGDVSEFLAYSSIPLTCLRPGLRNVALYDKKGTTLGDFEYASLLVRIKIDRM